MEDFSILIGVGSFLFTIVSALVGFLWNNIQKLKDIVLAGNSINDTQAEKISQLEATTSELKVELKELRERTDNKTEEVLAQINAQETTLNTFIMETRLHRKNLEATLSEVKEALKK